MSEQVVSAGLIKPTLDVSKGFAGGTGNGNVQLADQIQFSSLLNIMVDTPQEALEAAQGQTQALDKPARPDRPDRPNNDRSRPQYDNDQGRKDSLPQEARSLDTPVAEAPGRRDRETLPNTPSHSEYSENNSGQTGAGDRIDAPATAAPAGGTQDTDDFVALVVQPITTRTQPANQNSDGARSVAAEQAAARVTDQNGKAPETYGTVTSKAAANALTAALTDQSFNNVGQDLYQAVSNNPNETAIRPGNHSAASALANKQGLDLSQRLGGAVQATVQVTVNDNARKSDSGPKLNATAGAQLASLGLIDDGDSVIGSSLQRSGANVSPDRQGPNTHIGAQAANAQGQNSAQDIANTFAQSVRAQANTAAQLAANAASNATPKAPIITADIVQTNTVAGPAGPSQVSQTAKANPLTATHQPEKPQAPAQQIAVSIKQAIGDGADKINIKLNPAHLGRVEVRMEIGQDGKLSAVILAERADTLELLKQDVKGLERALQSAGLDTNGSNLEFGLKGQGNRHAEAGSDRQDSHGGHPSENKDTPDEQKDQGALMNKNVYGRNVATNGGVDIRI